MELFQDYKVYPEGFFYWDEFLTIEEEASLLRVIATIPLHTFVFQGYEAKRRVASFGYDYSFNNRRLTSGNPIPETFRPLIEKVAQKLNKPAEVFSELLITEYPPGAVINWHRDAPPFDIIAGISLKASCTFRLRPHATNKEVTTRKIIPVPLAPRSLYLITDDARTVWEHSTAPVKDTRYSITLRTLR